MSLACFQDIYQICCEDQEETYPLGRCSTNNKNNDLPLLSPQRIKRKIRISA